MLSAAAVGRFTGRVYSSPLSGVSSEAWDRFVRAMSVQAIDAVSESGGYGSFDLRPRRLAELGVMVIRKGADAGGRRVGDFILPRTADKFRRDPIDQYRVFQRSMVLYAEEVATGRLRLPVGVTLSGALAILHVGGTGALQTWPSRAMERTALLCESVNGIF